MPKNQNTAAKRARAAARSGAKFTAALRGQTKSGTPHLLPYLEFVDETALPPDERLVLDCLRSHAANGEDFPIREADPEAARTLRQAQEKGIAPQWRRWASVHATADGYVLREVAFGPNRSGYTATRRGPRVPVPVRAADGTVVVVAMPEWARLEGAVWVWAHTGWPIECPGRIVDPPQEFAPAPSLRWQIAAWHDLSRDGQVLGEDYAGSASSWETVGWCTTREDASLIARAHTAHRSSYTRADVLEHGPDLGVVSVTRETHLRPDDAPRRTDAVRAAGPRPASPDHTEMTEPDWNPGVSRLPRTSLHVWTGSRWRPLVWTEWQANHIAAALGIGAGGPYEWAEVWGPHHPDRDLHDWTQEGRALEALVPEPSFAERTQRIDSAHLARHDALVTALAERGGFTADQAAEHLQRGGDDYLHVLDCGQAAIARALHTARRDMPEGAERTAVRHALDALLDHHQLPGDPERIANEQLDRETHKVGPEVTAWCRRAVAEYITPAHDPAAAGVDAF